MNEDKRVSITKSQRNILERVNGGEGNAPPLPRKTLDELAAKGLVEHKRLYGLWKWRITPLGKANIVYKPVPTPTTTA